MIRFPCEACGAALKSPEGTEGRNAKCQCGNPVTVPYPVARLVSSSPPPTPIAIVQPVPPRVRGIPVICPHCRAVGDVPHDLIGQPIRCGHCQAYFAVSTSSSLIVPPPGAMMAPPTPPNQDLVFDDGNRRRRRPRRRDFEDDYDDRPRRPMLIEKTSKFWKGQMLISAIVAIIGTVMTCAGAGDNRRHHPGEPDMTAVFGVLMLFGGLFWFIIARVGAWWNHG